MKQKTENWEGEFDKAMKPKKYCGGDHCSGMWNLECDDIEHNDGRELVIKSKAISFISNLLKTERKRWVEEVIDKLDEIKMGEFAGMKSMPAVVVKLRNRILEKLNSLEGKK